MQPDHCGEAGGKDLGRLPGLIHTAVRDTLVLWHVCVCVCVCVCVNIHVKICTYICTRDSLVLELKTRTGSLPRHILDYMHT